MFGAAEQLGAELLTPLKARSDYSGKYTKGKSGEKIYTPTERDYQLKNQRYYGLDEWKDKSGYHQRSLSETTFSVTQKHWGNRLRTKTPDRQDSEVNLKVAVYNYAISQGLRAVR